MALVVRDRTDSACGSVLDMVVVLAEARNLAAPVVPVLGCWTLMRLAVVS